MCGEYKGQAVLITINQQLHISPQGGSISSENNLVTTH